jgi:YHS domain-containing protein
MKVFIDPVCAMKGEVKYTSEMEGKKVYFCSDTCREEFDKNPERYRKSVRYLYQDSK